MPDAPTPAFILSAGLSLSVMCEHCREMRTPNDLALALTSADRGDVPVDRLLFKCTRCGCAGVPWVQGPGNMLMGRKRYWPPED